MVAAAVITNVAQSANDAPVAAPPPIAATRAPIPTTSGGRHYVRHHGADHHGTDRCLSAASAP
jgi:hypothetical protein